PAPNAAVVGWFAAQHPTSIFKTAVTEAEILYGLRLLPDGRRRRDLQAAILLIFREDIGGRVLPFDRDASNVYATIVTD
ncbi:VapC toxin family PIN domain ribonuclease, partial [Rhizobium ruizarguesonis]